MERSRRATKRRKGLAELVSAERPRLTLMHRHANMAREVVDPPTHVHLCYRYDRAVLQVLHQEQFASPRSRPKRRAQLLEKGDCFYNGRRRQPSFKPSAVFIDRLEEPGDDIRLLYAGLADGAMLDRAHLHREDFAHPHANEAGDDDVTSLDQMSCCASYSVGPVQRLTCRTF